MSRRAPGSTQRANTSGLFANGDTSLPPPSTIAAQIVQNQAPEQGNSDPQNREIFGHLLQEYLQDAAVSSAAVDPEEVDLKLSAQLVTVVCKAGLDVLLEDNPFVGEVLVSQAIDSLSVVQLTVRKSPELLFYTEKVDSSTEEKPLLVWLLPKLLALVGQPKLKGVQGSLERLLSTFLRILAKPTESWDQALRLVELYRACVTDVAKAIESAPNGSISIEIPSANAISKLWSPGDRLITIPRDCQLKVRDHQRALSIALILTRAMEQLEDSDHPKKGGILKPSLHNCTIWELDVLRRLWRSFYVRSQRSQDVTTLETLPALLARMTRIAERVLHSRQPCRSRAIMLFLNAHSDLLRLAMLRSDDEAALNMVSTSLLDMDESAFFGSVLRQNVEEMLQAQVYQICSSEEQFDRIAKNDLSTLLCALFLRWHLVEKSCRAVQDRIGELASGAHQFEDGALSQRIRHFVQSTLEPSPSFERPSKRRRLEEVHQRASPAAESKDEILLHRLRSRLLDSISGTHALEGFNETVGNRYPSLAREEQQAFLRELSYVGCVRSGQLQFASGRPSNDDGLNLDTAICLVCDEPMSRPESNKLVLEDDIFLEVKSTLETIPTISEFKSSNSARIMYCATIFRFLQHAPRELLNIKEPLGQWCLRSLRSSSRELRVAAGKTLTLFSDDCVPEDLRKQNRLTTLDFLRQLSEVGDVSSQETTVLALRRIARVCREDELNIVLLLLVDFLGNTNPVISGVAYTELKSLAEDFDQKPDDMFRPFWRTTAIAVVKDFITCPQKIQQLCDLIGRSVKQFLGMTLVDTLPYLIWTKNTTILNRIAERSGTSVGQLCSGSGKNLAAILSFLLLRTPSDPERNVMELLCNAAPEFSQYDLSGWVKFQPVMIACEMLKSAADEDPRKRPEAHKAIEVLANLAERKSGRSSLRGSKARASFFSEYVLGIMAHFSDVIDAIRGDHLLSERRRCLRAIQELVVMADQEISVALPQVRACLQSALDVPGLRDEAFSSWSTLVSNLHDDDMETMLHHTFAVITQNYDNFSTASQNLAFETLSKLIKGHPDLIRHHIDTLPSLASIPLMSKLEKALKSIRIDLDFPSALEAFTLRCQDENAAVVIQSLQELLQFLESNQSFIHEAAIAQPPPPIVSFLCRSILDASVRFAEGNQEIGTLCAQALGMIGCLDPYRVESVREKKDVLVLENFESFEEVVKFVVFLLETVIVKAFHSATNARAQGFLAYAMQELLAFCNFRQLASYRPRSSQVDNAEYRHWIKIPENIRSTLTPFLSSHYNIQRKATGAPEQNTYPIFSPAISYATWLRTFVLDLLHRGKGDNARMMFSILARIIQGHDLSIPSTLLPIAVLNVVIGGTDGDANDICEEFLTVLRFPLQDQDPTIMETIKQCSENVLRVLEYLMRWQQKKRKIMLDAQSTARRTGRRILEQDEERDVSQISAVERILFAIPAEVISRRAVDCGSYAQALFHWESHIRQRKEREGPSMELEEHNQLYQHLQDIYAEIDEPDEIEGVSAHLQVLDPEQQILEYKKAGRWSAVQTWYEQELNKDPTNPNLQASLLASLKEAGQYDSLLNYVDSFQKSSPATLPKTLPFAAEASWVAGKWDGLQKLLTLDTDPGNDFNVGIGRALVALRHKDTADFQNIIGAMRESVARGLTNSSTSSLQACHEQLLKLHVLYEVEAISGLESNHELSRDDLLKKLDGRLEVLGAFTADKQYLLNIRRAAMELSNREFSDLDVASVWLTIAKLARKEDLHNIAFNAVLHATRLGEDAARIEQSRLLWKDGQSRKAILNLQGALKAQAFRTRQSHQADDAQMNVTTEALEPANNLTAGKGYLLLAKWIENAGQTASGPMLDHFRQVTLHCSRWEKGQFHLGSYYSRMLEADTVRPPEKQLDATLTGETTKLTIDCFLRSMAFGAKYYHQTVPKVLTLWLGLGEDIFKEDHVKRSSTHDRSLRFARQKASNFDNIQRQINKYTSKLPAFVFYTALTQIMTRISHPSDKVFDVLQAIILKVISTHPQQALWSLFPVLKSTDHERSHRGKKVMNKLKQMAPKSNEVVLDIRQLINHGIKLTDMLLHACEYTVEGRASHASLHRNLGFKHNIAAPCKLVVPVEATLTVTLPTVHTSLNVKMHKAFPASRSITIESFDDDVLVLSSLQRPRKLTVRGSNGQKYGLLCKPKDDLRKDQRLMEFNSEIGRALKRDVESRKRRLYIHTYAVTPLNEECGAIEWVDGLKALRDIIMNLYGQRNVPINYGELRKIYARMQDNGRLELWREILEMYPPILHEWFVETFPDPEAWLTARLRYTRSCAVTSIVGHILGLGDRHGENVNLEEGNGGVFHVDFNCLFDKGLTFERPELVPFRLTDNMVDAFGAYGVEGPFRVAAELALKTCRNDTTTLMTILETFLYDPTADFVSKRKRSHQFVPDTPQGVLESVKNKLKGYLRSEAMPLGVEGYVNHLIREARDPELLAQMYIGWCAYF